MSTDTSIPKENLEELVTSLFNYLEVLIDRFPEGVTQKELAEMASVTPSAVSRIKEKLFLLCDMKALAFESRLVLKPSIKLLEMAVGKLLQERNYIKVLRVLSSRYGEAVITKSDIHKWICQKFPLYALIFGKEESELGARVILRYVRSFRGSPSDEEKLEKARGFIHDLSILGPEGEDFLFGVLFGNIMRQREFDWPIDKESEILTLLKLRDKFFVLIKYLLMRFISGLSVLDSRDTTKEKELFKKVYEQTIDFYLRKIFDTVTESLKISAKKRQLQFPKGYEIIGENVPGDLLDRIGG